MQPQCSSQHRPCFRKLQSVFGNPGNDKLVAGTSTAEYQLLQFSDICLMTARATPERRTTPLWLSANFCTHHWLSLCRPPLVDIADMGQFQRTAILQTPRAVFFMQDSPPPTATPATLPNFRVFPPSIFREEYAVLHSSGSSHHHHKPALEKRVTLPTPWLPAGRRGRAERHPPASPPDSPRTRCHRGVLIIQTVFLHSYRSRSCHGDSNGSRSTGSQIQTPAIDWQSKEES